MTTTIQIDDETKQKLFDIKLELERKKGSAISYNDLINFLLENQIRHNITRINMKDFRDFEGILPDSALDLYYEEKHKELAREEQRAPLDE
ncbi:MAG: hypothetical protein R6U96_06550 [Promethearchaeia archaeon]